VRFSSQPVRRLRHLSFYLITISIFSVLAYLVVLYGEPMEAGKSIRPDTNGGLSTWGHFLQTCSDNLHHPLAILLLQIITIILVARVFSFICRRIGQPSVIGEIAAGIFLGPSFLSMYFPEYSAFLFPPLSMGNLQFLSQIGLILFMFIIGMELDLKILSRGAAGAVVISHASIIIPFAMGMVLSYFMYDSFAPENVKFLPFSLFMGIAMSITAFPVLARILHERGMTKSRIGTLVITCAAADDVTAWFLLAAVIAIVKAGSFVSSIFTISMAAGYVAVMLLGVRPFLKKMGEIYSNKESLSKPVVAVFFVILLLSSFTTEIIGIHALFGAFVAGVIMPSNMNFRNIFIEKVEDVSLVLLLPLFFVFTGLRTEIGLLNEGYLWGYCAIIIAIAVAGKFVGSALAARFVGQSWKNSLTIGALMNTRGLMELVVLNIGYDLGVLSPEIFAMMVIMALATTLMTGPALDFINWYWKEKKARAKTIAATRGMYRILLSFGTPERGISMIRIARAMIGGGENKGVVTALHLSPAQDLNQFNAEEYERESFKPINEAASELNLPVKPLFKPSLDFDKSIAETANDGNYDLLLAGIGRSVFEGSFLGKMLGFTSRIINPEVLYGTLTGKDSLFENTVFDERTRLILKSTKIPVGILIDKGLDNVKRIVIPVYSLSDNNLLTYAQKFMRHGNVQVTLIDVNQLTIQNPEWMQNIVAIQKAHPGQLLLENQQSPDAVLFSGFDLVLISLESWKTAAEQQSEWLSHTPTVLILKS
jgi:Kef-type K+ transport system membrane component KefB